MTFELIITVILTVGSVIFLLFPLFQDREIGDDGKGDSRDEELSVLALEEIEHDFLSGKLSEEDYKRERDAISEG